MTPQTVPNELVPLAWNNDRKVIEAEGTKYRVSVTKWAAGQAITMSLHEVNQNSSRKAVDEVFATEFSAIIKEYPRS